MPDHLQKGNKLYLAGNVDKFCLYEKPASVQDKLWIWIIIVCVILVIITIIAFWISKKSGEQKRKNHQIRSSGSDSSRAVIFCDLWAILHY